MSSPSTSESQTDNCIGFKAISLSQPITSLPSPEEERQTGAHRPGPKNRTSAGSPAIRARPTRNFGCTHAPGRRMKSQGNGLQSTARGFGKRFAARQGKVIHEHDATTQLAAIAINRVRCSVPGCHSQRLRQGVRQPRNPANTHTGIRNLTQLNYASMMRARQCQSELSID